MPTHVQYQKMIEAFLTRKSEGEELLPVSSIRDVQGKEPPEFMGYRVQLVRENSPAGTRDSLGINVNDPLETEFVELSRDYGKLNFESHKPGKGCDVLTYFLDPYCSPFRLYRQPRSPSGTREYVSAMPSEPDLLSAVVLAQWTSERGRASTFQDLNYSLTYGMLKTLRDSNAGLRFIFGQEYLSK